MLAEYLVDRGHEVVRWASSFDHGTKSQRVTKDTLISIHRSYKIWLLRAPGYAKNISLARIRNHRHLATKFHSIAPGEPRPDIIVCSLPTLELADEVVGLGLRWGVPVVVDVRDMWPDVILFRSPAALRPVVQRLVGGMARTADRVCSRATAITGQAPGFVAWGLARAKRAAGPFDRSFPFGYESRTPSESSIAGANAFWDAEGIGGLNDDLVVTFIGSISHQFEFQPVLHAARRLDGTAKVTFVLCGTGDMLEEFRRQTNGLSNVLMPGWVSLPQSWALLKRSSIGLVALNGTPDFLISIPNKVAEYLAAGLPIAASFSTGIVREMLERHECGFSYLHSGDVLIERLTALCSNRASLAGMSQNAHSLYEDQFRADRIYPDFVDYLEAIQAAGRPKTPPAELSSRRLN